MKYDYRNEPTGEVAEDFYNRLSSETTDSLARSYGDGEATKASIFLFVNRAFEAHLPERWIAEIFGKSLVSAGYDEQDEEPAFALFEAFAEVARGTYGD